MLEAGVKGADGCFFYINHMAMDEHCLEESEQVRWAVPVLLLLAFSAGMGVANDDVDVCECVELVTIS